MIDFEAEIDEYRPSLEVDAIEDAIVRSDLTDMNDLMMELIKDANKR
jgi:hypothetical protein